MSSARTGRQRPYVTPASAPFKLPRPARDDDVAAAPGRTGAPRPRPRGRGKGARAAGSAHLGNRVPLVKTGCGGPSPDLDPNPARLLGCAEPHEAESAQPCSSRPRSTPTSCMGSILSYTCLDARTC
jgi:hypothetical protein